jgi:hypothetical protein
MTWNGSSVFLAFPYFQVNTNSTTVLQGHQGGNLQYRKNVVENGLTFFDLAVSGEELLSDPMRWPKR